MLAAKQAVARMHKIFLQLSVHLKSSRKYLSANVVTPTSESLNDTRPIVYFRKIRSAGV